MTILSLVFLCMPILVNATIITLWSKPKAQHHSLSPSSKSFRFRTNSEPSQKEHLSCLLSVFLELRLVSHSNCFILKAETSDTFPWAWQASHPSPNLPQCQQGWVPGGSSSRVQPPWTWPALLRLEDRPLGGAGMAAGVTSNQFWVWLWQLSCLLLSFPHAWSLSKHCSMVFLGVLWIIQQPFHNPFSWCNQPGSVSVACRQGFCPNEYQRSEYHFLVKRGRGQSHRWLLGCGLSSKDKDKRGTGQASAARPENVKSGQMFTVTPERRNLTWAESPEALWN